ncbi:RNA-binding E3 ubiquitin-protein ligase MEX3C [Nephila pilipes]|uniref:RNA-binding E3 ubiquitin-protein ligase MEX3C n=1 Tax=Nephila pilipes TaxID=299642 RepID=A0A8X6UBE8_NEPPI|nr:RNA-binding E3 ubiquitin-protein ligase MEX3C [Nephila pilipes]
MPASLLKEMERSSRVLEEQQNIIDVAYNLHSLMLQENESVNMFEEHRSKKSQNTTECVPVPSSEHVAEIVGRQGCKIKALRAKTNTYIKTPVRGEEPVFVVTGRKEDVNAAKREILSAAEHFSQIRAQRKNNLNGILIPGPNSNIPGQTTIQVRVPYRVVGLVVGPKGATIKRIQQTTNTYIVTPSREKEPIFDVTGLPENVESARKEIEAHIAMRTGGSVDDTVDDYISNNPLEYTNNLNAINSSIMKNELSNNFYCHYRDNNLLDMHNMENILNMSGISSRNAKQNDIFNNGFNFGSVFPSLYDNEDGLVNSPTCETQGASHCTSSWPDFAPTIPENRMTPFGSNTISESSLTDMSDLSQRSNISNVDLMMAEHMPARRMQSDPVSMPEVGDILGCMTSLTLGKNISMSPFSPLASTAPASLVSGFTAAVSKCTNSSSSSPIESLAPGKKLKRDCTVCYESEIVAALIPCGHNSFCMECAQRIADDKKLTCPVCYQAASQAIRIYN